MNYEGCGEILSRSHIFLLYFLILADPAVKCCRNGGAKLYTDNPAVLMSSQVNLTMSSMNQQPPVSHLFFLLSQTNDSNAEFAEQH